MLTFNFQFRGSGIDLAKMLRQLSRKAIEEGRYGLPKEHAGRVWYISATPHEEWADETQTIERITYPAYSHSLVYEKILVEHLDPWPELERRGMLPLEPEHRQDEVGIVFALGFQAEGGPLSVTVTVNPVFAEEFDRLREELRPVLQVSQRVLTLGDLYRSEPMLQSMLQALTSPALEAMRSMMVEQVSVFQAVMAQALRSPVLEAMRSLQGQAEMMQAAMQQAAFAADAMQSVWGPPRPLAPTIIARREPSLRPVLDELESLPEGEQFALISEVHQALPPSVQERFLQEAIAQYVRNNRGRISTLGGGLLVVGVVEQHHHHHYHGHAPRDPLPGEAAPVSEMPPRPGEDGATWDDVFDWYYRAPRAWCRDLTELASKIGFAVKTVHNHHSDYKAQYGERPMLSDTFPD